VLIICIYSIAFDRERDDLYYLFDWGDGSSTNWLGPYSSEYTVSIDHMWVNDGEYLIKIKAKDEKGLESEWTTLEVTMPKGKNLNYTFRTFFSNYPMIYQLLCNITKDM
jgi:PKD domain-containing protein